MKRALLVLPVFAILGLSLWWMVVGWEAGEGAPMKPADYVPMVLGIILTSVLGCGLMALLFISSRRGYDEAATSFTQPQTERAGGSYNLYARPAASGPEEMANRHADDAPSQRATR